MINIASVTDSDFTDVLMTFYVSILENNLDHTFQFFIIDDKLTRDDKAYFKQLLDIYHNIKKIEFVNVNAKYYKKANLNPPTNAIKENTYYRLDLPLLVPVSRLLYLDADMICTGDISGLWNSNLHGYPLGAIEDGGFYLTHNRLNEMHVSHKNNMYFNAGVLLFDIKKWNDQHLTEKLHQFITKKGDILKYQDQDALNAVLNGNWQLLDTKYDVQDHLARQELLNPDPGRRKMDEKARENPVIIHYTEWGKPWIRTGKWVHPWRAQYYWYKYIATQRLHEYEPNRSYVVNKDYLKQKRAVLKKAKRESQ